MYIKLNNEKQKEIITNAIKKAGSYRKLAKLLDIPRSSIVGYYKGSTIPQKRFVKVTNFLKIKSEELIIEKLEDNWRQIKGGKNCVKAKKQKGTYKTQLREAQKRGAIKLKEWHKRMKKENPEKYYFMQHSKFKKIAGYKHKTENGEKVRNHFEKKVADTLTKLGIKYEYEPLIKIENRNFFPDFLINKKIILECTEWRGVEKAYKLKERIEILQKRYKIFIVIPKHLYIYYKILDKHLIKGLDEFVPVAQTFLNCKK